MRLKRLWLENFRSYESAEIEFDDGLTAIIGQNGTGKTNILEALGCLATLKSFRGSPTESLIRRGSDRTVIRGLGIRDEREVLIELELAKGRTRAQVNRQKLQRTRDLLGALRITVFAPDDLALVKEGPAIRRQYLDEVLVALDPRIDKTISDLEKALKQRNALLRQSKGRLDTSAGFTLDVWDQKLGEAGDHLVDAREQLLVDLMPGVGAAYELFASDLAPVVATYRRSWPQDSLVDGLTAARIDDVRRRVTTVGPHRDDVGLSLDGFASRTESSQGEQRTLALALRFAGHELIANKLGEAPLLLLDDVLSELDADRGHALLTNLPPGQTVITSASELPPSTVPDHVMRIDSL
jgi:DNA replication and repair protein RecF